MVDIRTLAFYLPQFHRTPENDAWWGRGFTEWTNVTRAKPRFPGHQQPRLPTDLGFYDLRVDAVRREQGQLARQHGVDGFVYYHYWFNGRRMLHEPFEAMLRDEDDDMPFALCWANEDWRANWDGRSGEVLLQQVYSEADDAEHASSLVPALLDRRCVRVDGRPLFLVYRAGSLPDPVATTRRWRDVWRAAGVGEVHLCLVESMERLPGVPTDHGFDAAVEFAPDWEATGPSTHVAAVDVREYGELVTRMLAKPEVPYTRYSGVTPGFDNTPRRPTSGLAFWGASPEAYGDWLSRTIARDSARSARAGRQETLVFVNAWNEWAEGAVLEPCSHFGRGHLEAHARALRAAAPDPAPPRTVAVATYSADDLPGAARRLLRSTSHVQTDQVTVQLVVLDVGVEGVHQAPLPDGVDLVTARGALTSAEDLWGLALGASRADVTVLVSADVVLEGPWLEHVLPVFDDPACGVVLLDLSPPGSTDHLVSAPADRVTGVAMALRMESLRTGSFGTTRTVPSSAHVPAAREMTRVDSGAASDAALQAV